MCLLSEKELMCVNTEQWQRLCAFCVRKSLCLLRVARLMCLMFVYSWKACVPFVFEQWEACMPVVWERAVACLVGVEPPVLQLLLEERAAHVRGIVQLSCPVVVQDLSEHARMPDTGQQTYLSSLMSPFKRQIIYFPFLQSCWPDFFYMLLSTLLHLTLTRVPLCRRMLGLSPGLLQLFELAVRPLSQTL